MAPATIVLVVSAAGTAAIAHPPNPHFRGVGDLPGGAVLSRALDVEYHPSSPAPSGITVVGESDGPEGLRAFRWTPATGIQSLGTLEPGHSFSSAKSVAYWAGTVIVGSSGVAASNTLAFYWSAASGMEPLPTINPAGTPSVAYALVDDVAVACVGQASTPAGSVAFVSSSSSNGALPSLGGLPEESAALDVSWNGGFKAGYSRDTDGNIQAVRWGPSWTPTGIGFLNTTGPRESRARAINYWGNAIVGESTSPNGPQEAFLDDGTALLGLGDLPGGAFRSGALAINWGSFTLDSFVVVGWSEAETGERAFIWTQEDGMRDLKTVLSNYGYYLSGWTLQRATGISAKGKAITGIGINPLGETEGWVAYSSCYVDCNGDLLRNVSDFGCFQTRFVAGDAYADCNEDGVLTVADFGCYQTAFVSASNCNEY